MKFYPDNSEKISHLKYASFKKAFSFAVNKLYFIGGRGYGKTYLTKKELFTRFVKSGKTFAWVRTSDVSLSLIQNDVQFFARQDYLSAIGVKSHKIIGNKIYLNNSLAGYFFSVNTSHNVKGGEYEIDTIVWDEFMKFGNERTVKNKRKLFFDLAQSIGRGDASKIIFLSNSTNKYDEVLSPLKLDLSLGFGCYLFRDLNTVVHYMRPSKAYVERVTTDISVTGMTDTEKKLVVSNEFTDFGEYGALAKAKYLYTLQVDDSDFLSLYFSFGKLYVKQGHHAIISSRKLYTTISTYVNSTVEKLSTSLKKVIVLYHDTGRVVYQNGYCRNIFQSLFAPT